MTNLPVTDIQEEELLLPTSLPGKGVRLKQPLPIWLPERRIYVFIDIKQSAAGAFNFDGTIVLSKGGKAVAELPCRLADFTALTPTQSRSTLFNAGGTPVGDSMVLKLAQPFDAAITSVVIQPTRINCEADSMYLRINRLDGATVTGFRAYLACLSTKL